MHLEPYFLHVPLCRGPHESPEVMPITMHVASPKAVYVRVHRRAGNKRLLSEEQIQAWADRCRAIVGSVEGPIYIMWVISLCRRAVSG